jgi:hypothetical protein
MGWRFFGDGIQPAALAEKNQAYLIEKADQV